MADLELQQIIKDTVGCDQRKGIRCSDCTSIYQCGLEMAAELKRLSDSLNRAAELLRKKRERSKKSEGEEVTGMAESQRKNAESQRKTPDREKLIRGLECCAEMNCGADCPYLTAGGCRVKVLEDAISLLREQEPVKPIFDEEDVSGRCGACGHALMHQSMVGDVLVDEWFQYCPRCGKKVKWYEQ